MKKKMCQVTIVQQFNRRAQPLWQRSAAVCLQQADLETAALNSVLPWPLLAQLRALEPSALGLGCQHSWTVPLAEFEHCLEEDFHHCTLAELQWEAEQHDSALAAHLRTLKIDLRDSILIQCEPCPKKV